MYKNPEKLYILPFDHRGSFIKMFGMSEASLTPADTATLCDLKHVVYEGLLASLEMGIPKEAAGVLVDEQFGAAIHREAARLGVIRILTTEKSGQDEFDFEYGGKFGEHIDALKPHYVKVLVRYNAEGDAEGNKRQAGRLAIMNDFCKQHGYGFLFELLASPTPEQLAQCHGDKGEYERTMQGEMMLRAIRELQEEGVEPDVWKLEGLENAEHMRAVSEAARASGRDNVGLIVLGRGESDEKVKRWLSAAATVPSVIGFAVGRTVFQKPLIDLYAKKVSRAEAAQAIAQNFKSFADIFEKARQ